MTREMAAREILRGISREATEQHRLELVGAILGRLVDDVTKDIKSELDHWKTCTGHATPEDQYLAILDAGEKSRARIAELEAALEVHAPNDPLVEGEWMRKMKEDGLV